MQPMPHLERQEAVDLLRQCLEEGELIPGRHFRDELGKERLCFEDAWHVLRTGQIYDEPEHDVKTGEWKYRVEGYETGGKWLAIILCFKSKAVAFLITVFSIASKRRKQ